MMASLSRLPVAAWWDSWTSADRAAARSTFAEMGSGTGFVTDLRQASAARSDRVRCGLPCRPEPEQVAVGARVDEADVRDSAHEVLGVREGDSAIVAGGRDECRAWDRAQDRRSVRRDFMAE
jgi:hypothetical protein